jgi:hypothetical protein
MKKLYLFFIIGAVAWGCGDKDKYLYTQIPVTPVLNPDTKAIIKDNTMMNVRLDSAGSGSIIHGITDKNAFATSSQFQDFTYGGYSLPATKVTPFSYDRNTIVVATGTSLAPVVYYSLDYGNTWSSATPVFSPVISTTGFYANDLVNVSYIDSNNLMLAYQQKSYTNADSRKFYKLDLTTKVATRVSYFDDAFQPIAIKFTDKKTGWMLLYKPSAYSTFISKTLDTGRNWSNPVAITNRYIAGLQTGVKGSLCALEDAGNAYVSADSGMTWKKPSADLKLTHAHMVNQAVIYGLTTESLVKSTDTGVTWNTVSSTGYEYINMKKVHFLNDQTGLMYGGQKLYMTSDGGVTWKTLLYPYSYVTE